MNKQTRSNTSERGVALIIVLLTILVLGILAATVTFTSQAQTWTAMNYRLSAQARYAAEAGVQNTMNWLSNNYTAPTVFTSYTTTSNPVNCAAGCTAGHAVVLSAISGVSSYYPDSTVSTAYNTALSGKSVPGITNATYSTSATLLRMNTTPGVSWLGTGGSSVIQTWQITSVGSITGLRNATVQVVATYERAGTPLFTYPI
jgi:Tfp pilus assembly protein PilX